MVIRTHLNYQVAIYRPTLASATNNVERARVSCLFMNDFEPRKHINFQDKPFPGMQGRNFANDRGKLFWKYHKLKMWGKFFEIVSNL